MESTKRAIKFQLNESKVSILKFWAVIFIVDLFAVFITKYTNVTMGINQVNGDYSTFPSFSLLGLNILPIIVYLIVYNYELYYKNFPISLSFSMIRKDFFRSMIVNNVFVVFILAVIQSILMKMDPILVGFVGKVPTYDFTTFNTQTDSIIFLIMYFFIALLLFSTVWNLVAALNYRFGARLWIGLLVLSMITSSVLKMNLFDLILPGDWLNIRIDTLQSTMMLAITILIYIGIYFVTINTDIKNKA